MEASSSMTVPAREGAGGPGGAGDRGGRGRIGDPSRGACGARALARTFCRGARASLCRPLVRRDRRRTRHPRVERRHVASPRGRCFPEGTAMNDTDIARALGTTDPQVNTDDALVRFRARVQSDGIAEVPPVARRRISSRWLQGLAAAAGVVIVASALTLSGVAGSILQIFEPKSVVGVPVSQSDLNYLSQACSGLNLEECMGAYGTFVWTTPPQPKEFQTRGQASAEAGFAVQAPTISSDGVTVEELRSYLLSQPGISPQLAAAIRAIGDPSSTLPVPVPAELAISHPVTVQGVQGLYVGDNTGIASAVIWQKDGMMFEGIGSFNESQALAIANSMR